MFYSNFGQIVSIKIRKSKNYSSLIFLSLNGDNISVILRFKGTSVRWGVGLVRVHSSNDVKSTRFCVLLGTINLFVILRRAEIKLTSKFKLYFHPFVVLEVFSRIFLNIFELSKTKILNLETFLIFALFEKFLTFPSNDEHIWLLN